MIKILNKIITYYRRGSLKRAVLTKLSVMWNDRKLINSFFFHNNIGDNGVLRAEMGRWQAFCRLHHRYGEYIYSLPRYEVTGEHPHVIWWCWLQGENKAPKLCKACLNSLKQHFTDYQIIVVDENNMFDYVHPPRYIIEKYRRGIIGRAHFADLLRTMLLVEHGGVWIDSTVFCTGYGDKLFEKPFFVYQNLQLAGVPTTVASNWLISSEKGHPIMRTMLELLLKYWEENEEASHYFFYHMFFHMVTDKYPDLWKAMPHYSNIPPHFLQHELFEEYDEEMAERLKLQSDFHKLTYKYEQAGREFTGLIIDKILMNKF